MNMNMLMRGLVLIGMSALFVGATINHQTDSSSLKPASQKNLLFSPQEPLYQSTFDYRHTFNIDAKTITTITTDEVDGQCLVTTSKLLKELKVHQPKVETAQEPVKLCKTQRLQKELFAALGGCQKLTMKLSGDFRNKTERFTEYAVVQLLQDCTCYQYHYRAKFGGPRTWINPLNIFQGPTHTILEEARACNLNHLLVFFQEPGEIERVRDVYHRVTGE